MADMCSKCSMDHGFLTDIDIKKEFDALKEAHSVSVLCEGCSMVMIAKDNGECIVGFSEFSPKSERRSKWFYYNIETNTVGKEYKFKQR